MIIFELACESGHPFDGWFRDHATFREQLERGLVECPVCGSCAVTQRLSTGGIVRARSKGAQEVAKDGPRATPGDALAWLRALRDVVEARFEDVGTEFARTALRMHYGVEAGRNIRGTTTASEEQLLRDEGVEFLKIPLPDPPTKPELQ
jgi:hypothetical protein